MKKTAIVKSSPTTPALTEDVIAETINSRFEEVKATANNLRMQMLGVGFTLVQAERELEKMGKLKVHNQHQSSGGLQAWLATHCPTLPYKTAMDWKNLAEKSLKKIGGDEGSALQLMLTSAADVEDGEWTDAQIEAREELYSCDTKGALKQMLMPFFGAGTVGRPKGSYGPTDEVAHITDKELCERLWGNLANAIAPLDRLCALVREMDYQRIQYFTNALNDLRSALTEQRKKLEGR